MGAKALACLKSHQASGRRWFRVSLFQSLKTPSSPPGRGLPLPLTPSPGVWRGGIAGRRSALEGPRWLQERSREPHRPSKIALDGRWWPSLVDNTRSRGAQIVTRRPDAATEPPKEALGRPKSSKNLVFFNVFGVFQFFGPMPFGGPKMAQMWLVLGPLGPNMAPRWRQDGPKMAPEGAKMGPRGRQEGSQRRSGNLLFAFLLPFYF